MEVPLAELRANAVVLFVGGPEDGRVMAGDEAIPYAIVWRDESVSGPGGPLFLAELASVGDVIDVAAGRLSAASRLLGHEVATKLFDKYGVGEANRWPNRYRLATIDGFTYVYLHAPEDRGICMEG